MKYERLSTYLINMYEYNLHFDFLMELIPVRAFP